MRLLHLPGRRRSPRLLRRVERVPLPPTLGMPTAGALGFGLAGVALLRRRRRRTG